jgi:hypothetical protein
MGIGVLKNKNNATALFINAVVVYLDQSIFPFALLLFICRDSGDLSMKVYNPNAAAIDESLARLYDPGKPLRVRQCPLDL